MSLLTGLVSYWQMDEVSGTRYDIHGSNDFLEGPGGTLSSTTGLINSCITQTAGGNRLLHIDTNSEISPGDIDFSFHGWLQISDKSADRQYLGKRSWGLGNLEYYFRYSQGSDRFNFEVSGTGGLTGLTSVNASSFGSPTINTWISFYLEHDSVNNLIGVSMNNGTLDTASHSAGIYQGNAPLGIGAIMDASGSQLDTPWSGLGDELGFWHRKLTPSERTALFNSGSGLAYSGFGSVGGGSGTPLHLFRLLRG